MPETPKAVKCWIDEQGIVWSHDCDGNVNVTPAVAVPREVYAEVRAALQDAESWANLAAHRGVGGHGASENDLRRVVIRLYAARQLLPEVTDAQ